jgi:hypothetical protein
VLGVNLDDLGDHRPVNGPPSPAAPCSRSSRPGSRSTTSARRRDGSGCARGTSRPPPALRAACRTAPR